MKFNADLRSMWSQLRRSTVARSAAELTSGEAIAVAVHFGSTLIAARALGATGFGYISIVISAVALLEGVASFDSWKGVIYFGKKLWDARDRSGLWALIRRSLILDFIASMLALATALAATQLPRMLGMNWPREAAMLGLVGAASMIFRSTGTSLGILRAAERFRSLAGIRVAAASVRLFAIGIAWILEAGVLGFGLAWFAGDLSLHLGMFVISVRSWHAHFTGTRPELVQRSDPPAMRDFVRFSLYSSLGRSAKLTVNYVDIIIVGAVVSPAASGLLKVIKQIGSALGKATEPALEVAYPEMVSRIQSGNRQAAIALARRTGGALGALYLFALVAFLLVGRSLLVLTFGQDFGAAWAPGSVFLVGVVISGAGAGLQPLMVAHGAVRRSAGIHVISSSFFLVLLMPLASTHGILGATVAYVAYYICWTLIMVKWLPPESRLAKPPP